MKRPETQQTVTVPAQEVHTGNADFDRSRFRSKGFNDKPEDTAKGDLMAWLGDLVDGLGRHIISHNTGMILGYLGAGYCLFKSAIGWGILTGSPIIGACVALVEQYLEMMPRLPYYFPTIGDKITFKLALNKFVDPKVDPNHPTLLEEAKEWGKDADRKRQRFMEGVSVASYILALLSASMAFHVINPRTLSLDAQAVFSVLEAVVGFEACMLFTAWMKANRLTHRESRKYNELKRRERLAAEQALMAGK